MSNPNIKFGTSGWRAVIAEDFNTINVKRVSHAIAEHIKENKDYGFKGDEYLLNMKNAGKKAPKNPHMIVSYDTRYLSEDFARAAAEAIADDNITVSISKTEAPVPAMAWEVIRSSASGGLMIAAGNHPAHYNGVKWIPFWGGPALDDITADIEAKAQALTIADADKYMPFQQGVSAGMIKQEDFKPNYVKQLDSLLDLGAIKKAGLKIVTDTNHGAAKNYLRPVLDEAGAETLGLREERDVLFGGKKPSTSEPNLEELKETVKKGRFSLGLACNCDGDRYGIVDSDGTWIPPNLILGLILEHLIKNRGLKGKVARSVMTSHFVDSVAKFHGLEVRQTPVGFKYVGNLMRTGQYLIGGEESSGLTIMGHTPERDGILACMLVAEMVAYERKSIKKILADMSRRHKTFITGRTDIVIPEALNMYDIVEKLKNNPPLTVAGMSVWRIDNTDGFKFIMKDGSWLGLRPSGTDANPVMRVYTEAFSQKGLENLKAAGKDIAHGKF